MKLKNFFLLLFANIWVDSLLIDDLSSLKTCGLKKTEDFEDREYLPPGFNSYSVKLKFNRQQCSGSIIQERTILTAGHCCHEIKDNPTVYFGEFWRRGDPYFDSLRFNVTARKVILHPEYRVLPTQFDACLVFLNDSIYDVMPENCSRSGCVEPVCLPNFPVESFTNYTAISSGFGRKTWMLSKTLDHYSGSILTEEMCLLHENMQKKKLHSGHFCIGNLKTINEKGNLQVDRITFCDGFSGSPLVVNSDGYATIVGILSWGGRCGRYKKKYNPLVFQKVHSILPWIQKQMELESFPIKITVSSDVSQNSSEPTEPPKVGAEPTKLPSILNTTLPEEKTPIPSVSTSSITKQTPSSLLPESVTDTGAAFVTSRKHLDSVSLDRQEDEDQESEGDVSKVVEIPSTSEVTFQTVNLATESTTKPAQSLPEASKSIDTDLVSPEIQNVKLEKLSAAAEEVHEILNKTNSSPKEEFTEVDADKSNFHLPKEFISASNSDLSEAIEGPFEPETNITMLVDNMNGNQNINAHFLTSESSHTPALIEELPSDSQSINLSGKRDQSANMDEILLPNFDIENDYTQVIDGAGFFEIPPIVDPDSALFNEKSGDYFSYSDFYVDDDSDYWQEKEAEISFEEAPIISETDSYLDELGKDIKFKEIPFEISIMQEKDRVPIIAHSSYGSSSKTEVIEPSIEWVYSAAETISSLSTAKPFSAAPNTHRSISATLNSTATTTTTSTTTTTTSPEPKTTSTHIPTSTRTTGTPHRTSTAESPREARTSTTIESTTTTSPASTTSTSTSTTTKTEPATTTKTSNTTSTTKTPATSKATTTTKKTTTSRTIKTTTATTTSTTVKARETEKATTTTSTSTSTKTIKTTTSTTTTPPTTTDSTTERPISISKIAKIESTTSTNESTQSISVSTTSIFKSESAKMPKSPVNTPLAATTTIPKTDEQTISSILTTSSTRHRRKHRTRKPHPDKKFSRKNSIKNKHNSGKELVTPKNVAALTQSPVSMDFSSVPAAMSSDAMHSTTSKIIGVDFYQEIVYDTEQEEAGTSELPLVTLFQNGAYVYSTLGIIVLTLSMCGCLAVRKQSRQCCSRQDSISKKNSFQETQSSRSSYIINDV